MRNIFLSTLLIVSGIVSHAAQAACTLIPQNLTATATLAVGSDSVRKGPGDVILEKRYRLSTLTGSHAILMPPCNGMAATLTGRMAGEQAGEHIYLTGQDGPGIRATLIYRRHGLHREWVLPFRNTDTWPADGIRLDELILKIELTSTSTIKTGMPFTYQVPALLQTGDNNLTIRLSVLIKPVAPECHIAVSTPVVVLPPLSLIHPDLHKGRDLNVFLKCNTDMTVSLSPTGEFIPGDSGIFANIATINPARNVGTQLFYAGEQVKPGHAIVIRSPYTINGVKKIPLSIHYGVVNNHLTAGDVKSRITLNVEYL